MKASLAVLAGFVVLGEARVSPAPPAVFKVVVNPEVPGTGIKRQVLSAIFLRKVVKWSDGKAIKPADLSLTSPIRLGFTSAVLGLTTLEVNQYWRQMMSRGIVPPPVKQSDDEVIAFVASTAGAIGYVASSTPTPGSVRELRID